EFAAKILSELSGEGHLHPEITELTMAVSRAIQHREVEQLIERVRTLIDETEFSEALKVLQQVLSIEPRNHGALALRSTVESRQAEASALRLLDIANQHLSARAFSAARDALRSILNDWPQEPRALQLLAVVDRKEREYLQIRQESERLYREAVEAERSD